jgi:hypothetical protein
LNVTHRSKTPSRPESRSLFPQRLPPNLQRTDVNPRLPRFGNGLAIWVILRDARQTRFSRWGPPSISHGAENFDGLCCVAARKGSTQSVNHPEIPLPFQKPLCYDTPQQVAPRMNAPQLRILLAVVISSPTPFALPQGTPVGGNILNETWTIEQSPYLVTNDVYISGSLVIREGVEVRMMTDTVFEVGGRLRAAGTTEQPVVFQPADPGIGWQGLLFRDAVPGSWLSHAVIQGSKNSGVRITNTPPAFTNCWILNNASPGNGGGILASVSGAPLILQNCVLSNNVAGQPGAAGVYGGGIFVSGSSVLDHCEIVDNRTVGSEGAGGGFHGRGEAVIRNSRILRNATDGNGYYWGGGLDLEQGTFRMVNCVVATNGAPGAPARGGGLRLLSSDVELQNCILAGNANSGVAAEGGSLRVRNCTIVSSEGSGVSIWSSKTSITNSIVFFNGNGGHQVDANATVRYSAIQGGFVGIGNIGLTPALCPESFTLLAGSPCIDAGHPGLEFRDSLTRDQDCSPYGRGDARNDMGAYGGPGVAGWTEPYGGPVIRIHPQNVVVLDGMASRMSVLATGIEPLRYQWFKDGVRFLNRTNAILPIGSGNTWLEHVGTYRVEVANALGITASTEAQLMVTQLNVSVSYGEGGLWLIIRQLTAFPACRVLVADSPGGPWTELATVELPAPETRWRIPENPVGPPRFFCCVPVGT